MSVTFKRDDRGVWWVHLPCTGVKHVDGHADGPIAPYYNKAGCRVMLWRWYDSSDLRAIADKLDELTEVPKPPSWTTWTEEQKSTFAAGVRTLCSAETPELVKYD